MKRIALIVVAMLLVLQTVAYADFDLTAMPDEELLALEAEIEAEKTARGLPTSAVLVQGVYRVGADGDLPAGRYIVVLEKSNQKSSLGDYYWINCFVYGSEYNYVRYISRDHKELTTENDPHPMWSVNLSDGCILVIQNDSVVRLVKTAGVVFE